jgi:hypothetical protein
MSARPPEACANCGAAIPPRAKACPACGADERTGWRDESVYDGLDLPDEAYRDEPRAPRRSGLAWYWIVAGLLVLAALVLGALGLR